MAISCPENGISCDCASFGISSELADNTGCAGSQGRQGDPGTPGANGNVNYVYTQVGSGDPNGRISGNVGDGFKDSDGLFYVNKFGGTNWGYD